MRQLADPIAPAITGPALECVDLHVDVRDRPLLRAAGLRIDAGEVVALMGPSGSGKTSLLHCVAGIRAPSSGIIRVLGESLESMSRRRRDRLRLARIGIILQFGELLPELTVGENVALPLLLLGRANRRLVESVLEEVGLGDRVDSSTSELSGGEIQRVAFARAIVTGPAVVLADEPTGSVDETRSDQLMSLLIDLTRERDMATLVATHDPRVAARADRVVQIRDCQLVPR